MPSGIPLAKPKTPKSAKTSKAKSPKGSAGGSAKAQKGKIKKVEKNRHTTEERDENLISAHLRQSAIYGPATHESDLKPKFVKYEKTEVQEFRPVRDYFLDRKGGQKDNRFEIWNRIIWKLVKQLNKAIECSTFKFSSNNLRIGITIGNFYFFR